MFDYDQGRMDSEGEVSLVRRKVTEVVPTLPRLGI